jgi:hypothetical protein
MGNGNVPVSLNNVTQMDKHQNDTHKNPIVNQEQNAQLENSRRMQRLNKPVAPEQLRGKNVDPDNKKEEDRKKKRRNKPNDTKMDSSAIKKVRHRRGRHNEGYFVDLEI